MSAPKNTILGHLIGIMTGYLLFKLALLIHPQGISQIMKFIVAGLALGFSGMIMVLTDILHPPAASSCLIAALGLVKSEYHIIAMMITICLICLQGYIMNKLAGVKYPLWSPFEKMTLPHIKTLLGDIRELEQEDKLKELAAKRAMRQKRKN